MAFSAWGRKNRVPVLGYDISSRLAQIDIAGEVSVFRRDNEKRMGQSGDSLFLENGPKEWAPRTALTLSHAFDVNGVPDRLLVSVEGYYNGAGTDSRMFDDTTLYKTDMPGPPREDFIVNGMPLSVDRPIPSMTRLAYFLGNGLYRPNEHSYYYAAFFTSFSRFVNSNMTLSFNAIGNIGEKCAALAGTLAYRDLRDLSLSLTVLGYAGKKEREYTLGYRFNNDGTLSFYDKGVDIQLTACVAF
jgi:hypothetical protein